MRVKLIKQPLDTIGADITITFTTAEMLTHHPVADLLHSAGFKGEQDQTCMLHERKVLVCGVENFEADNFRSAAAAAVKVLENTAYTSAKIAQHGTENIQGLVEGLLLGSYRYNSYKSEPKEHPTEEVLLSIDNYDSTALDESVVESLFNSAVIIADATNFTRDLVNTTPDDMTPQQLSIVADELATSHEHLECTILDEHALEEEKMDAMLSVGRASDHKPRLIHLSYKPENPKHVITLVGKGLTYDSGGLSLKPATSMVTMKMDKAGACAVLGMLKAVSELNLPVEVHGFLGAAENMVSGNAYKPDDVLTARNGKTIEVRNTDAEGRLVLADVLCYAQDNVKADYIFDFATLTGACMVALGPYTTGVMGHNNRLKHEIFQSANESGELVGSLPFNRHLKKLIKSEIADICNIGSKPYGGAITAALFLDAFITDEMKEKWLHFDIAGPAYTESSWDCNPHGGTGAGVRLMLAWLRELTTK